MAFLRDERSRSVTRACRLVKLARSTFDYIPIPRPEDEILRAKLKELAGQYKRWGLPRLHSILKKAGTVKNHKRTERIYMEEKLQIKRRKRKKLTRLPRVARPVPTAPDQAWSMDFVHDWLTTKRKLKTLTIVDDFTKESIGILIGHSISGAAVARYLASLSRRPALLRSDNGPEFNSTAFLDWIDSTPIEHEFITPGKPNENAFIESFNSRFRDECLNEHVFRSLEDASHKIEVWRKIYNEIHPHSSLGMISPKEFADNWKAMVHA